MNLKKNLPRTKLHDLKYRFKFFHLMNNRIQGNFSGLERGGGSEACIDDIQGLLSYLNVNKIEL